MPGGKNAIGAFAAQFSVVNRKDVRIIFDGDAKPSEWPLKKSSQVSDDDLNGYIQAFTGQEIQFHIDGGAGGGNHEQKKRMQRQFIDWVSKFVSFLPGSTPEDFILKNQPTPVLDAADPKKYFSNLVAKKLDDNEVSSSAILAIQREHLALVPQDHADFLSIGKFLQQRE